MMYKRITATAVSLVLSLSILSGCSSIIPGALSGSGKDGSNAGAPPKNGEPAQKLVFWSVQQADINIGSAQKAAVKQFETSENCDIELSSYPYAELQDKMLIALASGQGPDIFTIDQIWVSQYAASKFVLPLDDMLPGSTIKEDNYFKGAWESCKFEGKIYSIPFDVGVWAVLYYNKTMFREAGLDPEKPPVTWEEFLKYGNQLTRDGKYGTAVWVGGSEAIQCMTDAFTFSAGGRIVDEKGNKALLNSEAGVRALDFWKACAEISPPGTVTRGEEESFRLFTDGKAAMFFYGEWGQETIKSRAPEMDYGVAQLPKPEGGMSIGTFGGFNLSINSNTQNRELAWKLIQFATGKEVEKEITMITPAYKEAANEYLKEKRRHADVIFQQLSNSYFRPSVKNYFDIAAVQRDATRKILLNEMGTKDALDEAAKKIDELLDN